MVLMILVARSRRMFCGVLAAGLVAALCSAPAAGWTAGDPPSMLFYIARPSLVHPNGDTGIVYDGGFNGWHAAPLEFQQGPEFEVRLINYGDYWGASFETWEVLGSPGFGDKVATWFFALRLGDSGTGYIQAYRDGVHVGDIWQGSPNSSLLRFQQTAPGHGAALWSPVIGNPSENVLEDTPGYISVFGVGQITTATTLPTPTTQEFVEPFEQFFHGVHSGITGGFDNAMDEGAQPTTQPMLGGYDPAELVEFLPDDPGAEYDPVEDFVAVLNKFALGGDQESKLGPWLTGVGAAYSPDFDNAPILEQINVSWMLLKFRDGVLWVKANVPWISGSLRIVLTACLCYLFLSRMLKKVLHSLGILNANEFALPLAE